MSEARKWKIIEHSWRNTSIENEDGRIVCELDLESFDDLNENNQDKYEQLQRADAELIASAPALRDERDRLKREKDEAYLERNRVVAALAKLFPSGIARTAIEGWSEDWHGCVYIDLPTGQVSWHYHDSHVHLFDGIQPYRGTWDGHSTEEKYQRVAALTPAGGG